MPLGLDNLIGIETLNSLHQSIAETPAQCTFSCALNCSCNGTTHSCHQENSLDELFCQNAMGNVMAAHHSLIGQYQNMMGVAWVNTQPFRAHTSHAPLHEQGVWLTLHHKALAWQVLVTLELPNLM